MNATERLQVIRREAEVFAAGRRMGESDDYLSEAYIGSQRAIDSWNLARLQGLPIKASLKSWVKRCARYRMLELLRESRRRQMATGLDLDAKVDDRSRFRREEFARELSDDARRVVQLALDPPAEVDDRVREVDRWERAWAKRRALVEFLREAGWCAYRIAESFREIADALGDLR